MATIRKFEELKIWQEARKFALDIHILTQKDMFSKDFSLKDQIKRSSSSVMDNIAEGFDRNGKKEFIQFLSISNGSLSESKSQLYRAKDFNYINEKEFQNSYIHAESLGKQIGGMIKYLQKSEYKGTKFQEPMDYCGNENEPSKTIDFKL